MASNGAGVFYSSAFFQIRDLGAAEIVRRIALFSAYSFSLVSPNYHKHTLPPHNADADN